jgi:hypothetical protein
MNKIKNFLKKRELGKLQILPGCLSFAAAHPS